jgi:sirohydrochlorin ferrochelatase
VRALPALPAGRAPVLVAVAHGSRDPRALATVTALVARVRALRPGLDVRLGHVELNEPLLGATLAGIAGERAAAGAVGVGQAALAAWQARAAGAVRPAREVRGLSARAAALGSPGTPGRRGGPDVSGADGARGAHGPRDVLAPFDGLGAPLDVVLVPLLLGRGHHVKVDLPAALAAEPGLRGIVAPPLGPDPLLAEALATRLAEAGRRAGDPVVLAAAGSRDPDAAVDTRRAAALLSRRLGGAPVVPAYASAAAPTVADAVAGLRASGARRIAVASYFTAPGRFATQCAAAAPDLASAPLGAHEAVARLVLHRYDAASTPAPGPSSPLPPPFPTRRPAASRA